VVSFKPVAGWAEPQSVAVTVVTNALVHLTGTYVQFQTLGGPGTGLGQFNKPRGLALDGAGHLYVADSENHRIQILALSNGTWSALGSAGTAAGQFNQPFGIALDANNTLVVADCNNTRVQRRNAVSGVWTVWGGPNIGSGQGSFNGPFDVALDSTGNLYVADHYNNRVQKMTPGGTWSTFIAAGFGNGFVRTPGGVAVDDSDRIYVTDHDATTSNGYSRIQRFNTSGVFQSPLLGSSLPAEGGLMRPHGLAIGSATNLYVADTENSRVATNAGTAASWGNLLGTNVLSAPEYVALDEVHGVLYVSDTGHHRILKVALPNWTNPIPKITVTGIWGTQGQGFRITWEGQEGWSYAVQYVDDWTKTAPWKDVPGGRDMTGYDGTMSVTDTNIAGVSMRTYRIIAY
jgi:tripartite motif-containing protein 71